jgi:superfamily II DNA/RNA helicase
MKFEDLNLEESVLDGLYAMNFRETTPIQELSIPFILEGKDIIGCAQTGTGKTAAYVLPIINELSKGIHPSDAINAVIMAPTRELAQQIDQQIEGFTYYVPVSAVAVYGGTDGITYAQQERGLQMGADIVIATPGRLISHLNMGSVDLSRASFFVLDEADRMLDMGFFDDIMQIYRQLPATCQVIMFSATMPPKIRTLAKTILKNPEEVKVAISRPPESIIQSAYICYEAQKLPILIHLFKSSKPQRVIIFSSSKIKVKELETTLLRAGFNVKAMHSDLDQPVREQVMKDFKNGHVDILTATDVVSRGIDINDISLIVNFDLPHDPEDYVHRIGRTARGTNGEGLAITFVSVNEQRKFKQIEIFLDKTIYKIPVDSSLGEVPAYEPEKHHGGIHGGGDSRKTIKSIRPQGKQRPVHTKSGSGGRRNHHASGH